MPGDDLDPVLHALADPTRRAVMGRVADGGPVTASGLADDFPVSRQAIAKHLQILRDAGLVTSERAGRETRFTLTPEPLLDLSAWASGVERQWAGRLADLRQRSERRRQ